MKSSKKELKISAFMKKSNVSRREFLEKTGVAALGMALIPGATALGYPLKTDAPQSPGSFIPAYPSGAPDYFCTFNGQGYYHSKRLLKKDASKYANMDPGRLWATMLNEDTLLGENGLARTLFPDTRDGLFFMLDDGWDVPIVAPESSYGSVILDIDKFPSFTGTPAERLLKLNNAFKQLGWRGIGLWIACQEAPAIMEAQADKYKKDINSEEPLYWVERMKWMAEAGVKYWKIDWGKKAGNVNFRSKLTTLAEKYAPGLMIEHAWIIASFNTPLTPEAAKKARKDGLGWPLYCIGEQGRLCPDDMGHFKDLIPISHIFRLYDITGELGIPSMVERSAQALKLFGPDKPTKSLLNCEIFPYLGAGLGICIGIMSTPRKDFIYPKQVIKDGRETSENILGNYPNGEGDFTRGAPLYTDKKMLETVRGLNWHRIAPPFPVGGHETFLSDTILSDSFSKNWFSDKVKDVLVQKAPATVCRNIVPVKVRAGANNITGPEIPYVVACRYLNGAVAIATMGRVTPETGYVNPEAIIEAELNKITAPVGLFGNFKAVTLKAGNIRKKSQVWAQDLAEKEPINITSRVTIKEGSLTITGKLAREICKPFNEFDLSEPGIVMVIDQHS